MRLARREPWRPVYDFWFPPGLEEADLATHNRMALWWMRGGATAELPPFAGTLEAAKAGRLDAWSVTPRGRLSLIVVLDQFPRGLHAGTPRPMPPTRRRCGLPRRACAWATTTPSRHPGRGCSWSCLSSMRRARITGSGLMRVVAHGGGRGDDGARATEAALRLLRQPGPRPSRRDRPLRPLPASQLNSRADLHSGGGRVPPAGRLRPLAVAPVGALAAWAVPRPKEIARRDPGHPRRSSTTPASSSGAFAPRSPHIAVTPPSITISAPVTKAASSEAR